MIFILSGIVILLAIVALKYKRQGVALVAGLLAMASTLGFLSLSIISGLCESEVLSTSYCQEPRIIVFTGIIVGIISFVALLTLFIFKKRS